jgi:hypothetical protein
MSMRPFALALVSLLLPSLASTGRAQQAEAPPTKEVVAVQVRPGVVMNYLGLVGIGKPIAAVVLLPGGKGVLRLGPAGSIGSDLSLNFLIRSRELFAREGFYVAALDVASDREGGMDGAYRLSVQHAQEIGHVIAHLKSRWGVPVWLVGTSSSTLSIVNAAGRLEMPNPVASERAQPHLPRPDGIVTTSSQAVLTPYCGTTTVYEASLSAIQVPALVVSHRDDGCECSPGSAAAGSKLLAALTGTGTKEHKMFTGGLPPVSGPCAARAPHGFFGIEDRVVKTIADWIKAR